MNDPRPHPPLLAELPLVAVHLTVVAGFGRVYDDRSYFAPLLAFVLGAHLLAFVVRRANAPMLVAAPVAVAGACVAATWILFPDTATFGLPTADTWAEARDAMQAARVLYPEVIAPTPVIVGFQLAAGLALWTAVWLADTAAYRFRTSIEPVVPGTAIFLFCSILGAGPQRVAIAAAFIASVLIFVASQRRLAAQRQQPWNQPGAAGRSASGGATLAVVTVAVLAGALIAPHLPGAGADPIVDWRGRGNERPSRVTVSPMVELKKRLVDQTNQLLFTVTADAPSYWRLTSLDRFDGEIWSSSGEFRSAGDDLAGGQDDLPVVEVAQTFTIEALSTIWVPAAFEPTSVTASDQDLRWDADSSTLIVPDDVETSDGMTYSITSALPSVSVDDLRAPAGEDPSEVRERYASLPADFPEVAAQRAAQVSADATSRYEAAVALQDWFRTDFTYSTTSPAGHGDDALVEFLDSRIGYCEQFAGAFAAMARSLGMPSRVAVGFTPGIEDAERPGTYQVLGEHAHAWPEVYFPEVGWVPFEPTPGRGMPGAQDYTGVAPQQASGTTVSPIQTSTTIASTTTAAGAPSTAEVPPGSDVRTDATAPVAAEADATGSDLGSLALVVAGIAALLGLVAVVRRRRLASRERSAQRREDLAWEAAATAVGNASGVVQARSETPVEYAHRLGADAHPQLAELAALVTVLRWSPEVPAAADVERAEELARQIRSEAVPA